MDMRTRAITLSLVTGLMGLMPATQAAAAERWSGEILGEVKNAAGVAQMGATVLLYNRYDQLIRQAMTNEAGKFAFGGLSADLYAVRVSLASFVPAIRRNIAVLVGSEQILKINLASVLSSIEIAPLSSPGGTLMSDEWKWVLRASQATRPVLRLLPAGSAPHIRNASSVFSGTTGVVRLSAGGTDPFAGPLQQDLGTAFAVATSLNGRSKVRVSGNLGYSPASGLPATAFRATYSREADGDRGPQVALTARQIYVPALLGSGTPGSRIGPALRTAALTARDKVDFTDNLHLEYGVSLESISFQDRINYMGVFGRASYGLGANGVIKIAYSSATDPSDLIARDGEVTADLNQDLSSLALLPRISRRDGHARVQRNQNYEAGYTMVDGSRTYAASMYREELSNAAFLLSGSPELVSRENLLADLNSRGVVFNAGSLRRTGYTLAVTQAAGEHVEFTLALGRATAFSASPRTEGSADGNAVRNSLYAAERPWFTARGSASVPWTGTNFAASYGWTDFRVLTPLHYSLTGKAGQDLGWNAAIRQPLPGFGGVRMEAAAEVRNMLAQGYLPISTGERRGILTNSPRALRGGLSFIF